MFEDFFKIDKSMGESRGAQILGWVILVGTIASAILYKIYF